jgi:hypothetical protein
MQTERAFDSSILCLQVTWRVYIARGERMYMKDKVQDFSILLDAYEKNNTKEWVFRTPPSFDVRSCF